jgi:thiamine-phosphate pyrophosphorylase
MKLDRLYVIVDRETLDARGVSVRAFAEELREGGVRLVQYRDKTNGPQEVLRAAGEIATAFEGVEATLILNDRADLAALLRWGVHVGQGDLSVEDVLALVRPHSSGEMSPDEWGTQMVGVSTHDEKQVLPHSQAQGQDDTFNKSGDSLKGADYLAIGPVFRTATKSDAEAVVGLEGVRWARALTTKPLVAIGGICLGNARSVIESGADSVAVISGLLVEGRRVRDVARDFLEILG